MKKGSKVYLEGQLQTRKWTDQNGQDRYTTEVVLQGYNSSLTMLDGRGDGAGGGYDASPSSGGDYGAPSQSSGSFGGGPSSGDIDDEIPF